MNGKEVTDGLANAGPDVLVEGKSQLNSKPRFRESQQRQVLIVPPSEFEGFSKADFFLQWDNLAEELAGDDLNAARRSLVYESSILPNLECFEFLDFVISTGEFTIYQSSVKMAIDAVCKRIEDNQEYLELTKMMGKHEDRYMWSAIAARLGRTFHRESPEKFARHAEEVMKSLPDSTSQEAFLSGLAIQIKRQLGSGAEAFKFYLGTMPEGGDYSGLILLGREIQNDFQQVLAMMPEGGGGSALDVRKAVISSWTRQQPEVAIAYVTGEAGGSNELLPTVVNGWAKTNSKAAKEWATSLPIGERREIAVRSVVESLAARQPEEAWGIALEEGYSPAMEEAMKHVYNEWVKVDAQAAKQAWESYKEALESGER